MDLIWYVVCGTNTSTNAKILKVPSTKYLVQTMGNIEEYYTVLEDIAGGYNGLVEESSCSLTNSRLRRVKLSKQVKSIAGYKEEAIMGWLRS